MFKSKKMKNQFVYVLLFPIILSLQIAHVVSQETAQYFVGTTSAAISDNEETDAPASRKFFFEYGAAIKDVSAGAKVRIWYPIAESNTQQTVQLLGTTSPTSMQFNREQKYQNQVGFIGLTARESGTIEFQLKYDVERQEASVDGADRELTEQQKQLFLSANSLVPLDGKPQELLKNEALPAEAMAAGKSLYYLVEQHMKYDKSKPGYGNGDAAWACDSQTGNCTDFHSLFISLARSKSIPARFEIGFPIPNDNAKGKVAGYHCWAWFHAEGSGWSPVDISEADKHPELKDYYFGKLTADRVSFSTGRDIELVPKSESGPLNYFVYPHVEVDGKVWPKDKIELKFEYANH